MRAETRQESEETHEVEHIGTDIGSHSRHFPNKDAQKYTADFQSTQTCLTLNQKQALTKLKSSSGSSIQLLSALVGSSERGRSSLHFFRSLPLRRHLPWRHFAELWWWGRLPTRTIMDQIAIGGEEP